MMYKKISLSFNSITQNIKKWCHMKLTIRNKLLLSFSASIVVPVIMLCVLLGYRILQNSRDNFIVSTQNELRQVNGAINVFFQEAGFNVLRLATHEAMQEADGTLPNYTQETEKRKDDYASYGGVTGKIHQILRA